MGMNEMLAGAQVSSNLAEAIDAGRLSDVDVVRACGVVARRNPLGVSVWRLRAGGDKGEIGTVLFGLWQRANAAGHLGDQAQQDLVDAVLYWLDHTCPRCDGRGYELVDGAPLLSDRVCEACSGSGRRSFKRSAAADWALETLDDLEMRVASQIAELLRD